VGLSATVEDPDLIRRWLSPAGPGRVGQTADARNSYETPFTDNLRSEALRAVLDPMHSQPRTVVRDSNGPTRQHAPDVPPTNVRPAERFMRPLAADDRRIERSDSLRLRPPPQLDFIRAGALGSQGSRGKREKRLR